MVVDVNTEPTVVVLVEGAVGVGKLRELQLTMQSVLHWVFWLEGCL